MRCVWFVLWILCLLGAAAASGDMSVRRYMILFLLVTASNATATELFRRNR